MDASSAYGGASQFDFISGFQGDPSSAWEVSSQPDEERWEGDDDGALGREEDELLLAARPTVVDDGAESVVSGLTGAQFR